MAAASSESLSPFIRIWIEPRPTIRAIVERDPRRYVIALAAIGPALVAMESAWSQMASAQTSPSILWPLEVALIAVFAGVMGVLVLYFNGAMLRWTGSILGGTATKIETRAALAWSRVPGIAAALINVAVMLLGVATPPAMMTGHFPAFTPSFIGLGFVNFVLGVWGFVVLLQCLGEVHGFSAWRALGAILIEAGIFIGALIALVLFAEILAGRV
jgi:Yip1 domain